MNKKLVSVLMACGLCVCLLSGCGEKKNTDQEAYRQYGINCMTSGDYVNAVDAFQKALNQSKGKITDMEIDICFYKAQCQYLNEDYSGALETYTAIIEYNKDPQAYFLRGCLYFAMDRDQDALNDFAEAAKRSKNDYELCIGIYEALSAENMADTGVEYLNDALKKKGDDAEDLLQKGRISYLLNDTQNAISYLQKALDKGCLEANFYLGEAYEVLEDSQSADAYFQAYLDAGIADSSDLCIMGERQMEHGDNNRAILYFETALGLEEVPNKQSIQKNMVLAYEAMYNFKAAKEVLREYVEAYPEDEEAARELVFLESR